MHSDRLSDFVEKSTRKPGACANTLENVVTFVVTTLFDEHSSRRELSMIHSFFLPIARITVVPRGRPILASVIDVEELFRLRPSLFFGQGRWGESYRTQEQGESQNFRVQVNMQSFAAAGALRSADLLFAFKVVNQRWLIRSCNLVYDEGINSRSPVTLTC